MEYKIRRDYTGRVFGLLTVINLAFIKDGRSYWNLKCACGNTTVLKIKKVTEKKDISCGCIGRTKMGKKTHGMSNHPAYHVWVSMNDRCRLPSHQAWHNYGGRGIKVCERWKISFESFWKDMQEGYARGLSLDRKNVDGNYEKSNCRWSTSKIQNRNRRNNVFMETPWGFITVAEASDISGIRSDTLKWRIKNNWTAQDMFIQPNVANAKRHLI